ncbi:alpha/beta fold hydrolase [Myxococcota bacterium]|nr:alpha/beta fold hydrolase [Myxococcota bacterium]
MNTPPLLLLHGLARAARSMRPVAKVFPQRRVYNWSYPSTRLDLDDLAAALEARIQDEIDGPFDAVTHSMGGILLRRLLKRAPSTPLRRLVMMAPPNHGSALARAVMPRLGALYGPAGRQLSDRAWIEAHCATPSDFMIIAGSKRASLKNPTSLLGRLLLKGEHDGTVTLDEARLEGARAWLRVEVEHTWIMNHPQALDATRRFLDAPP